MADAISISQVPLACGIFVNMLCSDEVQLDLANVAICADIHDQLKYNTHALVR